MLGGVEQLDQPGPVGGQGVMDRLAAQGLVELLVLGLGQRGGHAVGGVQSRQRRGLVDARVDAVDQPLPADLLQIGEFQVGPGLDPLGDVLLIIAGGVLGVFLAVGSDDADQAVVEIDAVGGVDRPML